MVTWPGSLPTLPHDTSETRQKGFLRSEMDNGPTKQRTRFTAVSRYLSSRGMVLTKAQKTTLITFYGTTLGEGGTSFTWVDPDDNATNVTMRFREPPSFTALNGASDGVPLWSCDLELEILP